MENERGIVSAAQLNKLAKQHGFANVNEDALVAINAHLHSVLQDVVDAAVMDADDGNGSVLEMHDLSTARKTVRVIHWED